MTKEEREDTIAYLEEMKESYIEGNGYERHPLPQYYAIENAIKALSRESDLLSKETFPTMTREKYQKTLIRMLDSVRDNKDKGKTSCSGVACRNCPIHGHCGSSNDEDIYNLYDVIEIVENWGKEHPINKTNGMDFLKTHPYTLIYNCDNEYVYITLDTRKQLALDAPENSVKIPRSWWDSEAETGE